MSIPQTYVNCDYWVLGYAVGDEFCNAEPDGPYMGRKKRRKKIAPVAAEEPVMLRKNDDDLVMAIVEAFVGD